ncbi:MAG: transposase family protein [Holosporales bacterium]|nr:transposase family protein [Holosporales bacterium]
MHKEAEFPSKKPRKRELSEEGKEYNMGLSRFRVKVEHVLAKIKMFRIISDRL